MSKIYTAVKGFVVVVTAGASIAVFTGLSSGIGNYILGSVIATSAVFLAFDTFGMAQALSKLNKENDRLHQSNEDYVKLNLKLESTAAGLRSETNKMSDNNIKMTNQMSLLVSQNANLKSHSDSLSQTTQDLTRRIDSLRLVQAQSKQLIQALMTAGDDFKQFQSTLTDSMDRIEHTSDAMTLLLDKLGVNQFQAIDLDQDGNITQAELQRWSQTKMIGRV